MIILITKTFQLVPEMVFHEQVFFMNNRLWVDQLLYPKSVVQLIMCPYFKY